MDSKQCGKCQEVKAIEDFAIANRANKRRHYCKPCEASVAGQVEQRVAILKTSPVLKLSRGSWQAHRRLLLKKYGLTEPMYDSMKLEQGNLCKICSQPQSRDIQLSVDHCHKTGKVRGLLCNQCNVAIGLFKDNVELLYKAAYYLAVSQKEAAIATEEPIAA